MKDFLKKLIARKRKEFDELKKRSDASNDLAEVRSIGATLTALKDEIAEAEKQLAEIDEPAAPAADEGARAAAPAVNVAAAQSYAPNAAARGKAEPTAAETRAKMLTETGKMSIDAGETRSTLISTGTIAKPTSVGGINDPVNTVSSIVDLVRVEDMTGMGGHKEAYITAWQSAGALTDGTAPNGSDPTFRTVAINPFLMGVVSYVSRELKKQTPLQYEQKVREGAMIAMRKKLANWIVSGGGTNEIYGIPAAVNTESTPASMVELLNMNTAIAADTLRKIVFQYGGDENIGGNAVLFLNKADLIAFGDVRGTNEKKAVYEITPDGSNPNTGIIKDGGLSVKYVICSDCTSYTGAAASVSGVKTMIYGDPNNYKLGLFGNFEVNVSEDYKFAEGLLTVRGEVMVGGNVICDKGFIVVNKKTS